MPKNKRKNKVRISAEMIGPPEDDLKHTVHVGIDGAFFGDVSFLGKQAQKATVVHKKIEEYRQLPKRNSLKRPSLDLSGRGPLLGEVEAHSKSSLASEHSRSDSIGEDHTDNWSAHSPRSSSDKQDHEDHEISNEEDEFKHDKSVSRLSSFDLGPSLMDEVFSALGSPVPSRPSSLDPLPTSPSPLTPAHQQQTTAHEEDTDTHNVETISPADERSLDSAIDMANELSSKSMLELNNLTIDSSIESDGLDSPSSPSSPTTHGSTFYVHSSNSKNSPKMEMRNISTEVASTPDNQMMDEEIENV